jgi:hypothetical protein
MLSVGASDRQSNASARKTAISWLYAVRSASLASTAINPARTTAFSRSSRA